MCDNSIMQLATVSTKSQVVIPSYMADELGINVGDKVMMVLTKLGVLIKPVRGSVVDELSGILNSDKKYDEELMFEVAKKKASLKIVESYE